MAHSTQSTHNHQKQNNKKKKIKMRTQSKKKKLPGKLAVNNLPLCNVVSKY